MKLVLAAFVVVSIVMSTAARAQDIQGLEICTVEKTMERRTSCLQSNVDFVQRMIAKQSADHQLKLDAANRQIQALKAAIIAQQATIDELKSAQAKLADDLKKKADAPAAKDATPAAAAKDGGK
jgi:TolA-binding protein